MAAETVALSVALLHSFHPNLFDPGVELPRRFKTSQMHMASRDYIALVRGYGLRQEIIPPHCSQQNGVVERLIRTLKQQ